MSSYNLIADTSLLEFKGYKISLNLIAKKCFSGVTGESVQQARKAANGLEIPPLANFEIGYEEFDPYD